MLRGDEELGAVPVAGGGPGALGRTLTEAGPGAGVRAGGGVAAHQPRLASLRRGSRAGSSGSGR